MNWGGYHLGTGEMKSCIYFKLLNTGMQFWNIPFWIGFGWLTTPGGTDCKRELKNANIVDWLIS